VRPTLGGTRTIEVIGAILPLAIAVTISPLPIIGETLLLFSKKPVANAGAYLAGFVLGITVVLGVLVAAADAAVLAQAAAENRTLMTADTDFGTLLALSGATDPAIVGRSEWSPRGESNSCQLKQ
jgi:hypothetical protein